MGEAGPRLMGLIEGDHCTHLAVRGQEGLTAKCGAGLIMRTLPGLWDPSDPIACVHCVREDADPADE